MIDRYRMRGSMSRKGNCWDNAVVESFFSMLKTDLVADCRWETRAEAISAVVEWIEGWYNRERIHSTLGDISPVNPKRAIDLVGSLKAPVLGLYGGQDPGIPLASVAAMQEALANGSPAARRSKFVVFPDAPHAFHADYRPTYRKAEAEDGWKRMQEWFKANGL